MTTKKVAVTKKPAVTVSTPKKPILTTSKVSTKPKVSAPVTTKATTPKKNTVPVTTKATTPPKKVTFVEAEEDEDDFSEDVEEEEEITLVPIEEGEDASEFYIPSKGKYMKLRTMIKPSSIKGAGMGVYAVDKIPKGAEIKYAGVKKGENTANHYYSWEVKTYDPETGEPDDEDVLYFIDASDVRYSNCARTVNCGPTNKSNNMDAVQRFGKFFYVAIRDIRPGEELFVDYGEQYRKVNLGMKGRY